MKGQLPLDIKKITEEDRIFLLNRFLTEIIASHQGSMYNTSFTLSLLALIISGFSVAYLTKSLLIILVYCVFSIAGLIFYIKKYKQSQKNLESERQKIGIEHDELFKYHLNYALKKGIQK